MADTVFTTPQKRMLAVVAVALALLEATERLVLAVMAEMVLNGRPVPVVTTQAEAAVRLRPGAVEVLAVVALAPPLRLTALTQPQTPEAAVAAPAPPMDIQEETAAPEL
jgi:hypothetical protein